MVMRSHTEIRRYRMFDAVSDDCNCFLLQFGIRNRYTHVQTRTIIILVIGTGFIVDRTSTL